MSDHAQRQARSEHDNGEQRTRGPAPLHLSGADRLAHQLSSLGNQQVQRLLTQREPTGLRGLSRERAIEHARSAPIDGAAHLLPKILRQERGENGSRATQDAVQAAWTAFEEGRGAYESGDYARALERFEAAASAPQLDPANLANMVWNIAMAKARLGDIDDAMTAAQTYGELASDPPVQQLMERIEAIAATSEEGEGAGAAADEGTAQPQTDEEAQATFELGREAYDTGDYARALERFEAAASAPQLDPANLAYMVWNIALAKARLGDIDDAMTAAQTYGELASDPPVQQLMERIEAIAATDEGTAQPQTDEEAQATFELGREAYDRGDYARALTLFEAATEAPGLEPSRVPGLLRNIAMARARLGDIDNAMTAAQAFGQYSTPEEAEALFNAIRGAAAEQPDEVAAGGGIPST